MLLMYNVCYDLNRGGMDFYVKNKNDVDFSVIPKGGSPPFHSP